VGRIFKSLVSGTRFLKMGPIGCPETSVLDQSTLRDKPEDGRIKAVCDIRALIRFRMPGHRTLIATF
jgi:hypothetical protein